MFKFGSPWPACNAECAVWRVSGRSDTQRIARSTASGLA
jgi:hypothetical protein